MFVLATLSASKLQVAREERSFLGWMRENGVMYTGDEYSFRLGIFMATDRHIRDHNAGKSFKIGHNKFSSWTPAEYRAVLTKVREPKKAGPGAEHVSKLKDIPDTIDWSDKGIVNPVRDQGMCGAGWGFTATTVMEGNWALFKNELLELSPMNVIDCDYFEQACEYGTPDGASYYVRDNQDGKWMLESDYPYKDSSQMNCRFDATKAVTKMKDVVYTKNEEDMKAKCAELGILGCQYDASSMEFEYYRSGVYEDPDCSPWGLCHSMAIVGYGNYEGQDYWLVKNSFGKTWGQSGYGMMARNKNGMCGIDMVTYTVTIE